MSVTIEDQDLGAMTAYGYAKQGGYTGTSQQFAALMASYGTVAQEVEETAAQIDTAVSEGLSDIETKKQEALADIPSDYTTLSGEVTQLKSDFDDVEAEVATKANAIFDTASGEIVTVTDGADDAPMKSLVCYIDPVQAGSGDPSPENVRPISGHTGVNVVRTGKNLGNFTDIDSPKTANTQFSDFKLDGTTYVLSFDIVGAVRGTTSNTDVIRIRCTDGTDVYGDLTNIKRVSDDVTLGNSTWPVTGRYYLKVSKAITWISFYWRSNSYLQLSAGACKNIMLESGTTATAYEAFGETIPITFPSEAGTVYGGYVDVVKGKLMVGSFVYVVDGTVNKASGLSQVAADSDYTHVRGKYYVILADLNNLIPYNDTAFFRCSHFKWISYSNRRTVYPDEIAFTSSQRVINWFSDTYTTLEEFNAYLVEQNTAGTPVTLWYKLPTPVEYDLDPVMVKTLLGVNAVWNSTGNTTIDYPCDTKLYIERLTQPTEDDMIANANITSGKYFMVGNVLYLSTTTIPAGDTINPGTNCTRVSLADALNTINA